MEKKNNRFTTLFHPTQLIATSLARTSSHTPENPYSKLIIGGAVTWTFELVIGHYLEVLKIAKQTQPLSYSQITANMTKEKGLVGVLDGYFPWGSIQCFAKGATLGFGQAMSRTLLDGHVADSTAEIISGGVGGGFQGLVMSPLLLLKTRVITDPNFRGVGGVWSTTVAATRLGVEIIRREGLGVLMKGSGTFTTKRVADWATRYFFAEQVTNYVKASKGEGEKLTTGEKLMCSLSGGILSATATLPIDVMVATIQDAKKAGHHVSIYETIKGKLDRHGVAGLFKYSTRGFLARIAHVGLTTMLMKTATSAVYEKYKSLQ